MSAGVLLIASLLAAGGAASDGAAATNGTAAASQPVLITADSTYYDRKEGLAVFKGHVAVHDADYQLHADRAYVFMQAASNTLSRIAAIGSVAITNGTKRAYGSQATYHRDEGLVVLHGSDGADARVLDETPGGARTVSGRKIRFWIDREQVEVLDATLSSPKPDGGLKLLN